MQEPSTGSDEKDFSLFIQLPYTWKHLGLVYFYDTIRCFLTVFITSESSLVMTDENIFKWSLKNKSLK